ncbi:MAG: gliding motility-associated C-terminal domain-containing protein [Saprospiraceae bacterium]
MRNYYKFILLFIVSISIYTIGHSQCNDPVPSPGLFCSTDHPDSPAPIICSLDCLDGFMGTLPDTLMMPQPDPLCDGGIPNNLSWFAFTAGSEIIDISIIPSNCTLPLDDNGNQTTIGIQAGIYQDCSWQNSIVCATDGCLDMVAETVNLFSNDFVIGQTYYLFVDGCGGSVCDYTVVVNAGDQAFEMQEITTISNDLNIDIENDTLCQNIDITFTLDDLDFDVNFDWTIFPSTTDYPSGSHPVIDTNSVTFTFSDTGRFEIYVYAYNFCDASTTDTFEVYVQALSDEYFSDITICQECFPIMLISPGDGCLNTPIGGTPTILTEDPNGDGVPGWLGTSLIHGPGLDTNLVNVNGCEYLQIVNVIEIPISPRVEVDYYFCLTDFPKTINGIIFNAPGDTKNLTLDGAASSGCDSLISITVHAIDLFGTTEIGNCDDGMVELGYNIINILPSDYENIEYEWYDENGDIVLDSDGIDSVLMVGGIGSYSVKITITKDGTSCAQTFGPFMVDVDNLSPETPTITFSPIEICQTLNTAQIYVATQNLGEDYIWTVSPNLPFLTGSSSDTIFVDITSGQDFEFCVHAVNGCGISDSICAEVIVNLSPESIFTVSAENCIDSIVTVTYNGTNGQLPSSNFFWNFNGGTIVNGADINSAGPFQLSFIAEGMYNIQLVIEENGCLSDTTIHPLSIFMPIDPPIINCTSNAGSVVFSWDSTGIDAVQINVVSGQSYTTTNDTSIVINGLTSSEMVSIELLFNADDVCGGVYSSSLCSSLPCPTVELQYISIDSVCLSSNTDNIVLEVNIIGDNSGIGTWSSPMIINDTIFDVSASGSGQFPISYSYIIGDCMFTMDTTIYIFDTPSFDYQINFPLCQEDGGLSMDIMTDSDNVTTLNGTVITNNIGIQIDQGSEYTIEVSNLNNCVVSEVYSSPIIEIMDPTISIIGNENILLGESENFSIDTDITIDNIQYIWVYDMDTICVDCESVSISPDYNGALCVYGYYGDFCQISDCIAINLTIETDIHIPNIFSPNNDGMNDQFIFQTNRQETMVLSSTVFDRWGNKVYQTTGYLLTENSIGWDGKFNNKNCPPGVYVYLIQYLNQNDEVKIKKGDVTLVR